MVTLPLHNLPWELKYKIISYLPISKLKIMELSLYETWIIYNMRWSSNSKWDEKYNWLELFKNKDFWSQYKNGTNVPCNISWDKDVDWEAILPLLPTELPNLPTELPNTLYYDNDTWQKIFDGDKKLYKKLINDILVLKPELSCPDEWNIRLCMIKNAITVMRLRHYDGEYFKMYVKLWNPTD